ncbi:hypothetical protein NSK_001196 [Nannochloropsis salina CCMP1776]|uniref:ApaG domain-containing protein n=1 Tax=Nannochloropsis salina CCMP1776 TaxID=1027361 RepID=A0A4D9DGE0_9STRA|nr:hypothetical protein NSK_001196 [Nannochloropsis salina CCMP1776]|eukprot:TFJ87849.1 hypothetical protein NSK_001196 [Nannochloropsis salina CCMP1776]
MAHTISKDHSRLVFCLYRLLLRDARRVRHSRAPFVFLQERPSRERYSHLWEITPDYDANVLDNLLPSYLRHELTTCELKAQDLERIIKANFRRFRSLGTPEESPNPRHQVPLPSAPPATPTESPSHSSGHSRRRSSRMRGANITPIPPTTLDQVLDDTMALTRTMAEQLSLFESTSVTESHGIRVIATATTALDQQQQQQQQQQQEIQQSGAVQPPPPYFFFYTIRVENRNRRASVQLMGRHWIIQDEQGRETDSVPKGSIGVVGHEPILRPGQKVAYMSGAKLPTPYGSMQGSFQMVKRGGEGSSVPDKFDARVSPFLLKQT